MENREFGQLIAGSLVDVITARPAAATLCAHKNTRSVDEDGVVMRCLMCGMGKNWVGNWSVPADSRYVRPLGIAYG